MVRTKVLFPVMAAGAVFGGQGADAKTADSGRSTRERPNILWLTFEDTSFCMDVHPVAYDTPDGILFPQLLRDAGYYCTNNRKTHYNTTSDNKACWDECSRKASYNSRNRAPCDPDYVFP